MMYYLKTTILFFVLICTSTIFAATVKLPQWFTTIPKNEYAGISEPGGDENQAVIMALVQYMFANHTQGYGYIRNDVMSSYWSVNDITHSTNHQSILSHISISDTISYDIQETKKLPTNEYVCSLTTGRSRQTIITISYEELGEHSSIIEGDNEDWKSESRFEVFFHTDNIGDWMISFYKTGNNDHFNQLMKSYFVNAEGETFFYSPKRYEYLYAEGKTKPIGNKAPCLEMSEFSICDNLLAGYRYLLTEVNHQLALENVKKYYNGDIPTYSDEDKVSQEIPIVLQTPINGISLYENILGSSSPTLFYSKNGLLTLSDSSYIKSFIDAKIQQYKLPPFSEYAKAYIEPRINEWQIKGEFEKTKDWLERVSEPNRKKKIEEYLKEVKEQYLPQYAKRQQLDLTLGTYDPDHEVYLVHDTNLGNLLIPVTIQEAPFFKQNWVKRTVTPHYDIIGREACISSIDFILPGGKSYYYKADTTLAYSSSDIQYNFSPLEIPLLGSKSSMSSSYSRVQQDISEIIVTTPLDINTMSSVLASYKNIFGKYEIPDIDITFPYVVIRLKLTGAANFIRLAKQSLALDLGASYITELTVPQDDKILFLVPIGAKNIYLTDGNGQRQLIYSGRLIPNKIYDGAIEIK